MAVKGNSKMNNVDESKNTITSSYSYIRLHVARGSA